MASQTGIIKLQGTIAGVTFVRSTRYEKHARRARGSVKKAKVNSVLRSNADNAKSVTFFARGILKLLKTVERNFASGDLWSRMIGRMFKAKDTSKSALLQSIENLELNERYTFDRCFPTLPILASSVEKKKLLIELRLLSHPTFPKEVKPESYLCQLIILFIDGKGNCGPHKMKTDWISYEASPKVWKKEFEKPKGAKYFLVVEGITAGKDNKPIENFAAAGFKICQWGEC